MMYANHIEEKGGELFLRVCDLDLEGPSPKQPARTSANAKPALGGRLEDSESQLLPMNGKGRTVRA
jgi:hypothetical protein